MSFFEYQLGQFYGYLYKCLQEWRDIYEKNTEHWVDPVMRELALRSWDSFADYWTYCLYKDCGIKRRYRRYGADLAVNESDSVEYTRFLSSFYGKTRGVLVQLFYDKDCKAYDPKNPLTQFCRHLVFDMNSLSIVSLGLPKCIGLTDFESMACIGQAEQLSVVLEEFLEGTMVIYNPRLSQFKQSVIGVQTDEPEAQEQAQVNADSAEVINDKHKQESSSSWVVSTRKVLGTSYFNNPGMNFHQMFEENMVAAGVNLSVQSQEWLMSHVLVFNVEHKENRFINPEPICRNTLVGAYLLKNSQFMNGQHASSIISALYDKSPTFGVLFYDLHMNQIEQLDINVVASEVPGMRVPHVLCQYSGQALKDSPIVDAIFKGLTEYQPGVMIKATGGLRTKIRNPSYTELIAIKGHKPITVSEKNKRHLFELYWSLRTDSTKMSKFMGLFETPEKTYTGIFEWYKNCIAGLVKRLHTEYQEVFVHKKRNAPTIPYDLKPLVGELHKGYKVSRQPTTKDTVAALIDSMSWAQVYWRIFGEKTPAEHN
jgi:hypothetical protein